jgi:hypothetical protein
VRSEKLRKRNTTHGMSHTREYRSYKAAKERCCNPNHRYFAYYGGRGIEFRYASFEEFFADLGLCPPGRSLDRRDVNGHYQPGKCRWATPKEQANNRRNRRRRIRRADLADILAYARSMAAASSNVSSAP